MPKRPIEAEDLLRLQYVSDPQVSPCGQRVLFSKKTVKADKNKYVTNLYIVEPDGSVTAFTQGEGGAGSGRWCPCGAKVAFISGREDKQAQIFVIPTTGGEAVRLTSLPEGSIRSFKWSPDGRWIAFDFRPTGEKWTKAAAKEREASGGSVPPREISNPWFRLDGDGYFLSDRHALYVVDTATGEHRLVYGEFSIDHFDYDWSPNSDELVLCRSISGRPMFEVLMDRLFRVNLEGQAWELESPKGMNIGAVSWSPDGTKIAFFGNDTKEGWGSSNVDLYVVSADGGTPTKVSEGSDFCLQASTLSDTGDHSPCGPIWSPDSRAIYVQVGWHGESQIGFAQLDRPGVELLTKGEHVITVGSLSKDGERLACTIVDPLHPTEIALYDISRHDDAPQKLTSLNQAFLDEVKLSRPESVWLETTDGSKVQAWVMYPINYLAPKRYPAVLEVHGGPHAQYGLTFFHEFQLLAAQGYAVVFSNPRGSKGYGEAHCRAIDHSWGDRDWEDIQTVMRWVQHQPYVHPGLVGIMGGSYGGYMTNWAISHTNDFRAAITDRCVSNLVSMAGTCDFLFTEDLYFPGAPWGDIEALWAMSPLSHFRSVTTPTLIIHSEGDLRCSVEQSDQVFAALCQLGVETRYIRYPESSSHGMSRNGPPDLRLHRLAEIVAWWAKHLGGAG